MPMPGCNPCCGGCTYFAASFAPDDLADNWQIQSGSWSVADGVLHTSSANARIDCVPADNSLADLHLPYYVAVTVDGSEGDVLRVYLGDTSTYVEYTVGSDLAHSTVAIHAGGSSVSGVPLSKSLTICVLESQIQVNGNHNGTGLEALSCSPPSEDIVISLGTGSTAAAAAFSAFLVGKHVSEDPKCYGCVPLCYVPAWDDQAVPCCLRVVLRGALDETIEGTYFCTWSITGHYWQGDNRASGELRIVPSASDGEYFIAAECPPGTKVWETNYGEEAPNVLAFHDEALDLTDEHDQWTDSATCLVSEFEGVCALPTQPCPDVFCHEDENDETHGPPCCLQLQFSGLSSPIWGSTGNNVIMYATWDGQESWIGLDMPLWLGISGYALRLYKDDGHYLLRFTGNIGSCDRNAEMACEVNSLIYEVDLGTTVPDCTQWSGLHLSFVSVSPCAQAVCGCLNYAGTGLAITSVAAGECVAYADFCCAEIDTWTVNYQGTDYTLTRVPNSTCAWICFSGGKVFNLFRAEYRTDDIGSTTWVPGYLSLWLSTDTEIGYVKFAVPPGGCGSISAAPLYGLGYDHVGDLVCPLLTITAN